MSTDAVHKHIFRRPPNKIFLEEREAPFKRQLERSPREAVFESSSEIEGPVFKSVFASSQNQSEETD